ncbi:glycosyltransferase [Petrotoga sp. 9PWA.NaAc.5.4]|uniref:glycosyltransferase n=1 Tax=Petrotoga sp. 9PWA.NaAc.5.4 TaxID=1434328 RepID=UPI000CC1D561|nr:glycosyltransferase [Petrotoga sp. 9PWA.NaAc.5.4]PNR95706.1 Sucrose-phosphate synthase [Petrotoga sp. 9PWA.NaAc.5.4]
MRVLFLNPQGNFDKYDSHLTEHPDFGGQLVYVKEVSKELAKMNISVDIVTRQIIDENWPEFSNEIDYFDESLNPRIVRIPFGGEKFLNKEELWPFLSDYVKNILDFYKNENIDFITTHYGDGGYSGVLLKSKLGINFSFTGHSLGAQKMDKLGVNLENFNEFDKEYHFSQRIMAERLSMKHAFKIIVSTSMERFEQYSHPLYKDVAQIENDNKYKVIPPGVNTEIFNDDASVLDDKTIKQIKEKIKNTKKSFIILSSRLDEKKNHLAVVKAFATSKTLQNNSNLAIFLRGINDPYQDFNLLNEKEKKILKPILEEIEKAKIKDKVYFFDFRSQKELASAYKYFSQLKSVFALTAFYEPFGLAPIEAGACGLAVVATKNGGPSEIFDDGSGVLVDPENIQEIEIGLIEALKNYESYSEKVKKRVHEKFTWRRTAEGYLTVIQEGMAKKEYIKEDNLDLNGKELIINYLKNKI